jgi:hypothetical protein
VKIRADIAELLRAGLPDRVISKRLRCDRKTVAAARAALRLPKTPPGSRQRPLADLLAARTEPVEGGHMRWTGTVNNAGSPVLNRGEGPRSVHRLVFIARHGSEPVGKVRTGCDYPGCVHEDHVEDQPMRERNRDTYAAIFGSLP